MEITKRKLIQYLCYYLLPIGMLFSIFITMITNGDGYALVVSYGNFALNLLVLILFVKPLSVIFPKITIFKKIVSYRRELGLLTFWSALFHGVSLMYYLGFLSIDEALKYASLGSFAFWGFLGLIGMIVLGATSNKLSVMKLKRNWKKVHYIAYPTFFFVLIHGYMSSQDIKYIILGVTYTLLKSGQIYITYKKKQALKNNA